MSEKYPFRTDTLDECSIWLETHCYATTVQVTSLIMVEIDITEKFCLLRWIVCTKQTRFDFRLGQTFG